MTRWEPVDSSHLNRVRYIEEERVLEIEFNNGGMYEYYEVPPKEYDRLLSADSHGSYFNEFIKGHYNYNRL
jgi:hypothetical protein